MILSTQLPLFPEAASTIAPEVDALYFFLIAVSSFFAILIFSLVFFFAIRYRRRSESERPRPIVGSLKLELLWTIIPLILSMVMFAWGAKVYYDLYTPPTDAMNIYVVGKQWMWKLQHPEGVREINELHVPVGVKVRLTMTSEDVIHSFFVPAFRIKMDVLPGRYTTVWFEATRPGKYHLFCAEYCGTQHSTMIGSVYVLEPDEYEDWLSGASAQTLSMAEAGRQVFHQADCVTCHLSDDPLGPSLTGLYGSRVQLASGETVVADQEYIRESILNPNAKIVAGYEPVMPTYRGLLDEEEILQLIAYIRSLTHISETDRGSAATERMESDQ
jgi:cytochrome c oxidase subunit II